MLIHLDFETYSDVSIKKPVRSGTFKARRLKSFCAPTVLTMDLFACST